MIGLPTLPVGSAIGGGLGNEPIIMFSFGFTLDISVSVTETTKTTMAIMTLTRTAKPFENSILEHRTVLTMD